MIPIPTYIYHITHIDNLVNILNAGKMLPWSAICGKGVDYTNIAHNSIQIRREIKEVPLHPYGVLHDYVPFYFAPRSPMLYTIHQGNVDGYTGGQKNIIHLVSSVQIVEKAECQFVFTDGHGIMAFTEFYNKTNDLDKIDWEIMKAKYWADTNDDPDRRRRRQAEFLVYDYFDWSLIIGIGVINQQIAEKTKRIIDSYPGISHKPPIRVMRHWYY